MYDIKSKLFTALLAVVFLLIICGCKGFTGSQEEAVQPHFSYEIYDENGVLLKEVSHERVDETEIETGLGLFGENFIPAQVAERIGVDPDDLRRLEIWLHAEQGVNEDVHFVTLNFSFPMMQQWDSGTYRIFEISKEQWLEDLRFIWKFLQDQNERYAKQNLRAVPDSILSKAAEQMIKMSYSELGFGTEQIHYMYMPTGGYLELENVSEDYIEGNFSAEMAGLPAEIMTADVFPEDPGFQTYRVTGSFVAEHGDYNDLLNLACVEVDKGEQLPMNPLQPFGCMKLGAS